MSAIGVSLVRSPILARAVSAGRSPVRSDDIECCLGNRRAPMWLGRSERGQLLSKADSLFGPTTSRRVANRRYPPVVSGQLEERLGICPHGRQTGAGIRSTPSYNAAPSQRHIANLLREDTFTIQLAPLRTCGELITLCRGCSKEGHAACRLDLVRRGLCSISPPASTGLTLIVGRHDQDAERTGKPACAETAVS